MSDNLRDRIAAVLNRHKTADVYDEWADCQCGHVGTRWDDHVADAVIEALGLRREWGALDDNDEGALAEDRDDLRPWPSETIKCRWITDWEVAPGE